MGAGSGKIRAAALLFGLALLWGCAAPGKGAKPDQPEPPFSVHLPVLETTDVEVRSQPPDVQPVLNLPPPQPSDAHEEGKARSLDLIDIHLDGGKPHKPAGSAPPEESGKP